MKIERMENGNVYIVPPRKTKLRPFVIDGVIILAKDVTSARRKKNSIFAYGE